MDPKLQDRLPPPGGGRKKKVSLAVDTAGHNSLSAAPQGSLVVTDNSLRDSSISVGFAGLRVNELANCAAQSSSRQQMPMGQVQHARDGGGSEGDRLALSEFKMVRVLGEGTSGVVKLVRHRPTNRRFAMKVIQLGCSEQERKQILIEVKTLHKSDVPHIIAFTDAFYVDNAVHLILEYMDCGSLHSVLKRHGPLPEPLLARVSGDMLGGLDHLHRVLKVVHRDIKPSNVLLNSRGEVKLADFGMSGQLASTFSRLASWVGTAAYMSPERISGSQYSYESDIWALGVSLWECSVGRYPYSKDTLEAQQGGGSGGSMLPEEQKGGGLLFWDLLFLIVECPPPPLPDDGAEGLSFSASFRDLVQSCMAGDGEARPSAGVLLRHNWLEEAGRDVGDLTPWLVREDEE